MTTTGNIDTKFAAFREKMIKAGLSDLAARTFRHYYGQLVEGRSGEIAETDIDPVTDLPDAETLGDDYRKAGLEAMSSAVVIKLNGGLGTSMGLERAKSLLRVRGNLSFLDIIARQAERCAVPLYLMNSFSTEADTRNALADFSKAHPGLIRDFRQNMVPKVMKEGFGPASWPADNGLEWCPPGHGDLYTALFERRILETLLKEGRRWAFVSNADNLGATLDPAILGMVVSRQIPFLMEAANRTEADKKGGHLAKYKGGQMVLRESAQCRPEDTHVFQDFRKHRYFNTNNLWLDLEAVDRLMHEKNGILGLPIIVNAKTLNPRDEKSPAVYQLETAMGAAIAVIPGASAIRVPRWRFAPVKTTTDLLVVQSDAYALDKEFNLMPDPRCKNRLPLVKLDNKFFKKVDAFESRFKQGAPSLVACESFDVEGDVSFGPGIVAEGRIRVINQSGKPVSVAAGRVLKGDVMM